jgi:nicotinamide phosphoribosyltransferase
MNNLDNILLLTDSYKVSHYLQYPPKTEVVYSYFESRGGKFPKTLFFGLQYYLKTYLQGQVVTEEKIREAKKYFKCHFGNEKLFNEDGWRHILTTHGGRLPVEIKAVPEGTVVDVSNVLMTIENTDPKCHWLTNYLETLCVQVWYGTSVSTQSYYIKKMITEFLEKTGDPSLVSFKLHDFGFRGVSSVESAGLGGCAHLVNFLGTDTMAALVVANEIYGHGPDTKGQINLCAGYSIPATEHSTITAWGKDHEKDAFENVLNQYPEGLVACVSDSFDIYNACDKIWGTELKDKVMSRKGTLVVRPDSGDPKTVVVKVLDILGQKFGYTTNAKGYKVLDTHVRVIQGDGVNYESIREILTATTAAGWSTDNLAFGCGGALLQALTRDTQSFAFKCSSVTIDGVEHDVYKKPVTDDGKVSKAGRLCLIHDANRYVTIKDSHTETLSKYNQLQRVFLNGVITKEFTLQEVRDNSDKQ